MKRGFTLLFIAFYAIIGIKLIIELCGYAGFYLGPNTELAIHLVWIGVCFSAHRFMPYAYLFRIGVRRTILEEEEWLHPLMHELNLRTGIAIGPRLLILEKPELNAFVAGSHTVVISRGLLVNLSELEMKAILAHEYGHIVSKDTITTSAFGMASLPLHLLFLLVQKVFSGFARCFRKENPVSFKLLLTGLIIVAIYYYPERALLILILFIFMKIFPWFGLLVRMVWCFFSRSREFKQDGFAQALGYGRHLKSALWKIDAMNENPMFSRINQFWLTHPIVYERIRRLEWLEGQRPTR